MQKKTRSQEKQHHDPFLMLLGAGAILGQAAAPYVKKVVGKSGPITEQTLGLFNAKFQEQVHKMEGLVSEMRDYYRSTNGARHPKTAKVKKSHS